MALEYKVSGTIKLELEDILWMNMLIIVILFLIIRYH